MKNRQSVHLIGENRAESHEKPHLRLLEEPPVLAAEVSERRSREEDELRSLIRTFQRGDRCVKDEAVYRGRRDYCGLLTPEDDLPPAA